MRRTVCRALWTVSLVVSLCFGFVQASAADCQLRCPLGMVCRRFGGSNFHFCMRRTPVNRTLEIYSGSSQQVGAGPRIEGRGESQASCPRPPTTPGPCVVQCHYHSDCPGQLCCSTGCGYTCTSDTTTRVTKPGSCPRLTSRDAEPCGSRCRGDGDCRGQRKCCRSRCGMTCRVPCFHWLRNAGINPWRLSDRCSDSASLFRN